MKQVKIASNMITYRYLYRAGFLLLVLVSSAIPGLTQTFPVNSTFDVNDLNPGNSLCVAYLTPFIPPFFLPICTLRAAIEEANALPGTDIIKLGSGTYFLGIEGTDEDRAVTGDLDITDSVRIIGEGPDQTFIDGAALDRVFDIIGGQTSVTFSQLTITKGNLPAGQPETKKGGGGVRNQGRVSFYNAVVSNNIVHGSTSSDSGGGIFNSGLCSMTDSTVSNNDAMQGGGVMSIPGSTLYITASTIMTNTATLGAGVMNEGDAKLTNSTFSNNTTQGGISTGGAIRNTDLMRLIHCTIADNSASLAGGISNVNGQVILSNTLLANNEGGNCSSTVQMISNGHNLDSGNSCELSAPDLTNSTPKLALLQNNGGPTQTYRLNRDSPAIDAGECLQNIVTDQRGVARPQRKSCDIGAVEIGTMSVVPLIVPLLLNPI